MFTECESLDDPHVTLKHKKKKKYCDKQSGPEK